MTNTVSQPRLRVIPLGGAGEVGRNCWALEYGADILILDMGIMFPDSEMLGVDLILPDITYLRERRANIRGVFITHGHEDHIGAVPYLLPLLDFPPVYATRLTLGLVEPKLKERKLLAKTTLVAIKPGETHTVGPFTVEPFHVAHSIPDAVAFGITTPAGVVVYLTDWKFDHTPIDNWPTDVAKMAALGRSNPLLLITDCVRAETPGVTPSERVISKAFDHVFAVAQGRVIVASFASSLLRVQQVFDTAAAYGRKVAPVGRSMERNVRIALTLGYLSVPEGLLISAGQMAEYPDEDITIICTGSQGEPMAALARMANREHRDVRIKHGDLVVLSASPIPGNEVAVSTVVDNLFRLGAEVIYGPEHQVHVSGHAAQEELKMALTMIRPQYVVPSHGEYRHMALYRKLAMSMGWSGERVLMAETGTLMEFAQGYGAIVGTTPAGMVYVDGTSIGGDVVDEVLHDRQLLAKDGILLVVVTLDRTTGQLVAGPELVSRGHFHMRQTTDLVAMATQRVRSVLERSGAGNGNGNGVHRLDHHAMQHTIKDVVSDYVYQQTRSRPMVLPIVIEV